MFPKFKERLGKGEFALNSDTLTCLLLTASYTIDLTDDVLADLSNECADGDYSRQNLTGVTWTLNTDLGMMTLDANNIDFGDPVTITAKYAVIFDNTHASDALVAICDLNLSGSVVKTTEEFLITLPVSGIWTLA